MSNFKSAAKRKRELAKLDKRHAKEQKRALRKAERPGTDVGAVALTPTTTAQSPHVGHPPALSSASANKPLTLTEAVERWKNTRVVKPARR